MDEKNRRVDYARVYKAIMAKKKLYLYTLPIAFALSCLIILPEPRYYKCEVMLAPEGTEKDAAGGLSSLASSFGINLSGAANDAIYPTLYPDLFSSPDFVVELLKINVKTSDEDGNKIDTDYYTYLTKHKKRNWLTKPFSDFMRSVKKKLSSDAAEDLRAESASQLDPKNLSRKDYELVENMSQVVSCTVDKKTDVTTICVTDQDRMVAAMVADSVRIHLQRFVTDYRTAKARKDYEYYKCLSDSAKAEYEAATAKYAAYTDEHQNIILQSYISKRDELENDMAQKYEAYTALQTQLMAANAKVQEKTPVFTTLKCASAPVKPAGPKRMIFVGAMLFLTFIGTSLYILKDIVKEQI